MNKEESIIVNMPRGVNNITMTTENMGDECHQGINRKFIMRFNEISHPNFKRIENDLFCSKKITLSQALHGFDFEFKELSILRQTTPQIVPIIVSERSVIPPNMVRKLPNLGMPFMNNPHQFGHVYIRYIVEFPKSIDKSWR